jgi:3-hydroxybutyryl-CoA dehydratase
MEGETTQLFLEDFSKGQIFPGHPRKITKADVLSFAALTGDKHPIHYDDEYAKSTRFGRPIVHGLHLMALTALGAAPLSEQLKRSMIAYWNNRLLFESRCSRVIPCGRNSRSAGSIISPGESGGSLRSKSG